MDAAGIQALVEAIRATHGAEARWVELNGCNELPTLPATDEGLRLLAALRQPDH